LGSFVRHGKEEIERQSGRIHLLVRVLAGVVVVLVVGVEFHVFSHGEQGTRVERSGAPLAVLGLVKGFGRHIRDEMIRANCKRALNRQFVSVSPGEKAVFPVQVEAVPVD
jgi:hypothetical protein